MDVTPHYMWQFLLWADVNNPPYSHRVVNLLLFILWHPIPLSERLLLTPVGYVMILPRCDYILEKLARYKYNHGIYYLCLRCTQGRVWA